MGETNKQTHREENRNTGLEEDRHTHTQTHRQAHRQIHVGKWAYIRNLPPGREHERQPRLLSYSGPF